MSAATYSDGYVTFTTTHFSSFLICEELGNPPAPSNSNTAMIAIAVVVVICVFLGLLYCLYTIKPELFHKSQ